MIQNFNDSKTKVAGRQTEVLKGGVRMQKESLRCVVSFFFFFDHFLPLSFLLYFWWRHLGVNFINVSYAQLL